jgi:hypothetical protein
MTFHPVRALTAQKEADAQLLRKSLENTMINKMILKLGFMNQNIDPKTGAQQQDMFGMTFLTPPKHSELFVYLNYSIVEPLLRDDLTSSERMGCEWFFANVLIHEMAVSKSVARVNNDFANMFVFPACFLAG